MTKPDRTRDAAIKMLVVGNVAIWKARGQLRHTPEECEFVEYWQLDDAKIREYDNGVILTPLVSHCFDAFDVAGKLTSASFKGLYRVVTDALPDADIIRGDIAALAPDLDFDLLMLPPADP